MSYSALGYSGIVDDAISQLAGEIKTQFIAGMKDYVASDEVQQQIADTKQQIVMLAFGASALTVLATYLLLKPPSR